MADYDVIVIGGGGAGLSAAIRAAEAGATVLVVEAGEKMGGSTALSGGVYYAAGTSVQQAKGISGDSADDMFEYYLTLNQYRVEPALARVICDHAAPGLEWLISLGVQFDPADLYASGVESVPRGHKAKENGAEIAARLEGAASNLEKVDFAVKTRVQHLLTDATGRVTGVHAAGADVTASAVVIASGGFAQNPEKLHRYYPEAAAHGDWTWGISAADCVGDGLDMGLAIGADVIGYNRGLLLTTPGFYKDLEVFVPGWIVYVNRDGRRFINETTEYAVMSGVVKDQVGGTCFAIFDDATRATAKPNQAYAAAMEAGMITLNWITDVLDQQIEKGKILKADTLEELAVLAGIRADALATTVATYNRDCRAGTDSQFFKDPSVMQTIEEPPYYAAEIRCAIVCLTSTGLRIDSKAHVLTPADQPIPGLYAAGETSGGVLGERYIGGGNSIANAIVFGQIAGTNAATDALSQNE
ncbi:MAG: FAD-dependent oxidoreductase [bacterium]